MKALLVLTLVLVTLLLAAATAVAYGQVEVVAVVADVQNSRESAALFLSGSLLIGFAGALRRLPS
jgi:hypothetical protein